MAEAALAMRGVVSREEESHHSRSGIQDIYVIISVC